MKGIKTGGRQAGTPNKYVKELRANVQLLVQNNLDKLQEDLDKLKPVDRVKAVTELAKFVLPTLKAVGLEVGEGLPQIILNLGEGLKPEDDAN